MSNNDRILDPVNGGLMEDIRRMKIENGIKMIELKEEAKAFISATDDCNGVADSGMFEAISSAKNKIETKKNRSVVDIG